MNKQLKEKDGNAFKDVFPINIIQNIKDGDTGKTLQSILKSFNSIFIEYKNNVEDTRNSIDESIRRKGLWVTYLPTGEQDYVTEVYIGNEESILNSWADNSNWRKILNVDYNSTVEGKIPNGIITMEKLSPALQELLKQNNSIINYPDDEDLQADYGYLQFKDRKYNPDLASGKGYKILRKNWLGVNNILTQDMINEENTIYVIRYDFDLNGKEITIPEGCVLQFEGGSLSNGILNGNNTIIQSNIYKIFNLNIIIKGNWDIKESYPEWFGAKGDGINDDSFSIKLAIDLVSKGGVIKFSNKIYIIDTDKYKITPKNNQTLIGEKDKTIIKSLFNNDNAQLINIVYSNNIKIKNLILDGNRSLYDIQDIIQIGIAINSSYDIKLENLIIKNIFGDGVVLGGKTDVFNIDLNNIYCENNARNGFSLTRGCNISINNSKFYNTNGKSPSCGIDIEPNSYEFVSNVKITNSEFYNNREGLSIFCYSNILNGIIINNCKFYNNEEYGCSCNYINNGLIENCEFYNNKFGLFFNIENNNIKVINNIIYNNNQHGININCKNQGNKITDTIYLEKNIIKNNSKDDKGVYNGINITTTEYEYIYNIILKDCKIYNDSELDKYQNIGLFVDNKVNIKNIIIENCDIYNNIVNIKDEGNKLLYKDSFITKIKINNTKVYITDINYDTNTFYYDGNYIKNNDILIVVLDNMYLNNNHTLPNEINGNDALYYVINANNNSFQLSKNKNGEILQITRNSNHNLNKWHFEIKYYDSIDYNIKHSNFNNIIIKIKGKTSYNNFSDYRISINNFDINTKFYNNNNKFETINLFGKQCGNILLDAIIEINNKNELSIKVNGDIINYGSDDEYKNIHNYFYTNEFRNILAKSIQLRNTFFADETEILIYEH